MPNFLYSFVNFLHVLMLKGALSALALAACFALVVLLSPQKNNLLASRKYLHIAVYVNRVNRHKIVIWNRMVNTLDMPVDNVYINSRHIPSVTTCRFVVWFVVANEICEVIHGDCIFETFGGSGAFLRGIMSSFDPSLGRRTGLLCPEHWVWRAVTTALSNN